MIMISNKFKKDVLESTPLQNRQDSGYEGHGVFGYNLEISPIRKNASYKYLTNYLNRRYGSKNESSICCEIENVCRKLPFINNYTNNKTVSSSGSGDSGIETTCKTPDNKICFNNLSATPVSQSTHLNLKSFPTDLNCDISYMHRNRNHGKFYQPFKYICKEGLNHQTSTMHSELLDKNNNEVKNVSYINRKPQFSPTIDFLMELNLRNCTSVISEILSYLPDEDLRKASNVCRDWKDIIFNDDKANKRRSDYINNRKNITRGPNKENRMETKCQTERSHKSVFLSIVNVSNEISKQPLYNDNLVGRFDSFCQEVKTLKEKEELMKCPKCNYPSKIESGTKYCCTRNLCLHEFCKKCFGPYVDNHICSELKLDTSLPSIIIGSKKSRKNLRRI